MSSHLVKFNRIKRKFYLSIIPLIILVLFLSLIQWTELTTMNRALFVSLTLYYSFTWLFLYKQIYLKIVELTNLILISCVHLTITYWVVAIKMSQFHATTVGEGALWTPLIYIYIFITLSKRKSLIYSFGLWTLTFLIGIFYLHHLSSESILSIIHYQVATFVYILFLVFARNLFNIYSQTEILEKMAYQDSLTKINNRRAVYKKFEEFKVMTNKRVSLIFFDLDYFKEINDEHGHLTGDYVLQEVAVIIQECIRQTDLFARWGGEEFIIVAENIPPTSAVQLAERLRIRIEMHSFKNVGSVTSSFGIAHSNGVDSIETLVEKADLALYEAKNAGRNAVKEFDPSL